MTTKEKVLAKCGEIWEKNFGDPAVWQNSGGWWDVRNKSKTICLQCKESTPETDPVWPLAAQILQIGDDKPAVHVDGKLVEIAKAALHKSLSGQTDPRPTKDLLKQAFDKGAAWHYEKASGAKIHSDVYFDKWVATLPADPLDADRELVKSRLLGCIDGVPQFAAIATNDKTLYAALKRLAGMEVQNG